MPGRSRAVLLPLIFCCWICGAALTVSAAESVASPDTSASPAANVTPHFYVRGYTVEGIIAFHEHSDSPVFQIHRHERQPGGNCKSGLGPAIGLSRPGLSGDERCLRAGANLRRHRHVQCCPNGDSRRLSWRASVASVSATAWKLSPSRRSPPRNRPLLPGTRVVSLAPTNTVPPAANFAIEASHLQGDGWMRWPPCA